jgi:tRNA-specific 2-thiouridylase
VNWLGDRPLAEAPEGGWEIEARVRSTRAPKPARLFPAPGGATVELLDAEEGVSPGQACVFYDGDRVLGGGWIQRD